MPQLARLAPLLQCCAFSVAYLASATISFANYPTVSGYFTLLTPYKL